MTSGNALLWLAVFAAVLSLLGYLCVAFGKRAFLGTARMGFLLMAASLAASSGILLQAFLSRYFNLEYVFDYSSRDLSTLFTISAFWAGQEGTFLLWALLGGILGVFFLKHAREDEALGMVVLSAVQLFILVLMLKKSPFLLLSSETLTKAGVMPGTPITDGAGMNPLLQDFWMAIHPPLIFLGYAALAIPFALALSALARRDYDSWVVRALPWTAFAWAALGSGIFVGGYWAYKVLGWGGYWGWDPVENASLIPWLTCTALLHGMLLQRAVQGMRRINLALAIISFLLILYGTFLTRSGVLGDFSVHSFADLGLNEYLVFFTTGFVVISLGILFWRWNDIPKSHESLYEKTNSREFLFRMGVILLSLSAILILAGTSSPLITALLARLNPAVKASKVDNSYYLWTSAPIGFFILVLLYLVPRFKWHGNESFRPGIRELISSAVITVIILEIYKTSQAQIWQLAAYAGILFAAVLALYLNLKSWIQCLRNRQIVRSGGYLAHLGFALMLIGILGSSGLGLKENPLVLERGETKSMLDHQFTFDGLSQDPSNPMKYTLDVRVKSPGNSFMGRPSLEQNLRTAQIMRKPYIRKYLFSDLYLIPQDYQEPRDPSLFEISSQQGAVEFGEYRIRFIDFLVPAHATDPSGVISVGAVLEVTRNGKSDKIIPFLKVGDKNRSIPAKLPGGRVMVRLNKIHVEPRSVLLSLQGPGLKPAPEIGVIQVSTKPLVNFVWLGTFLMVLGGCLAVVRRGKEYRANYAVKKETPHSMPKKSTMTQD